MGASSVFAGGPVGQAELAADVGVEAALGLVGALVEGSSFGAGAAEGAEDRLAEGLPGAGWIFASFAKVHGLILAGSGA